MLLTSRIGALLLLGGAASAEMIKNGTTCTVTPLTANTPALDKRGAEADTNADAAQWLTPPDYPRPAPDDSGIAPRQWGWPDNGGGSSSGGAAKTDDTPQVLDAFKQCGNGGTIIFQEGTYYLRQVMDTRNLRNVDISIHGRFEWPADDINYWLRNSISVTYAGRSTSWMLGGENITMRGYGKALFFGNGQIWYDQNRNQGNQNGRPITLTLWEAKNVWIDGITWRQSQFWNTFIAHSQNITITNVDMNSTSATQWSTVNTDGTNTWNSRDIRLDNWKVTCGDDCIAVKGNSTNVYVSNVVCHESGAMVIGSLGNPTYVPDYVDNVVFENITLYHSSNAAWIKTYAGTGHVKNVTFKNVWFDNVNQPIYISPCIYTGQNCDGSRLQISDVTWKNITGTSRYNVGAGIHCSASAPCQNLKFEDINIKSLNGGSVKYLCSNFNTGDSGLGCTGTCPANFPQQLNGNQ